MVVDTSALVAILLREPAAYEERPRQIETFARKVIPLLADLRVG
jgi:uncharacterized protein with PIN domain